MIEDHDDFAFEPVPGLPARLPEGESMLWQGSPDWKALALSAFHVRKVATYFALLGVWQVTTLLRAGGTIGAAATSFAWVALGAAVAVALLGLLAWAYARGTIYTLTSRRIIVRSGLALPITLNLPLTLIETVAVTRQPHGTGGIALTVSKPNRVAWLVLWPNVRPWTLNNPQPMLRCLTDAEQVAPIIVRTLRAIPASARVTTPARVPEIEGHTVPMPAAATMAA